MLITKDLSLVSAYSPDRSELSAHQEYHPKSSGFQALKRTFHTPNCLAAGHSPGSCAAYKKSECELLQTQ